VQHVDISSSLYFAGLVSAFVPVVHCDYRPPELYLSGLNTQFGDLAGRLPFESDSVISLSCMHVVEHVGLGRYGDAVDPQGDVQAMHELSRVLAPGGDLLFVVPVGRPRVCFNAHRIYSFDEIREAFRTLQLHDFKLVPDRAADGGLIEATPQLIASQQYGCGCFWFKKLGHIAPSAV
jgi:SAM-dependent methyltransferase